MNLREKKNSCVGWVQGKEFFMSWDWCGSLPRNSAKGLIQLSCLLFSPYTYCRSDLLISHIWGKTLCLWQFLYFVVCWPHQREAQYINMRWSCLILWLECIFLRTRLFLSILGVLSPQFLCERPRELPTLHFKVSVLHPYMSNILLQ